MKFNFELTEQEAQIVLNALVEIPYKVSAPVVEKIQLQAIEQRKQQAEKQNI